MKKPFCQFRTKPNTQLPSLRETRRAEQKSFLEKVLLFPKVGAKNPASTKKLTHDF
jgi:hypothetical protein